MSVRLIKIAAAVVVAHVVFLSIVLVGFPIPLPKPHASFVYTGSTVVAQEMDSGGMPVILPSVNKGVDFDHFDAPTFEPWMKLRDVNKPR